MREQPSTEAIAQQLEKILASPDFTAGPRIQKFLAHIVNEELEGRGEFLKGTALAMDIFGRGADFDSNNDSIVRIEAIKLRKAIEHYYLTAGVADEIIITVPKGRYRPQFVRREVDQSKVQKRIPRGLPTLAILQFEGAASEKALIFREGLPEEIALELARFGQIKVLSGWHTHHSTREMRQQELIESSDYILRGNVREAGGSLRVSVQLERNPGKALVWSDRFRISGDLEDPFDVQEQIARKCATRMADAYGAVAEDLNAQYSGRRAEDAGVFEALMAFHAHMRTSRRSSLEEFSDLIDTALRDNPSSGLAHALKAIALIEEAALGARSAGDVVAEGRSHAETAIALAPNCQEALYAAASFARFHGENTRYANLIERAIEANPNATLLTAMVGGWLAAIGDTREATAMIDGAREHNPLLPIWINIPCALDPFMRGEYEVASDMISEVDGRDNLYDWMLIAAMHAMAGRIDIGKKALAAFFEAGVDPEYFLRSIPLAEPVAGRIEQGISVLLSVK